MSARLSRSRPRRRGGVRAAPNRRPALCHDPRMELTFLGGARTVTGSRHLVDSGNAKVLIDCGMFQGGPAESVRNHVPLGVDPATLDAVVLTHAHLDHCGLLPLLVREGFRGRIVCTSATAELARLVRLDSAKLQEEFAKRSARRERHDPARAAAEERREESLFEKAMELAAEGRASSAEPAGASSSAASASAAPAAPSAPAASSGAAGASATRTPSTPSPEDEVRAAG